MTQRRHRFDADGEGGEALAKEFVAACATGDIDRLMAMLTEDVVVWTDGGGKVRAALRPIRGPWRAARFLVAVSKRTPAGSTVAMARVNGQPGLVIESAAGVQSVLALDVVEGRIQAVRVVSNPDKLGHYSVG
ncbi:MAG: hypothetical protein ACR2KC_01595 [Acidimicrobiales bacterium]